jgi:polyvinyl alcohol dehydrogenase (cytochrome)
VEFIAASRVSILVLASLRGRLAQDGGAVYQKHCAQCHDKGVGRAPQLLMLSLFTPEQRAGRAHYWQDGRTGQGAHAGGVSIRGHVRHWRQILRIPRTAPSKAHAPNPRRPFDKPFSGPYWNGWGVDAVQSPHAAGGHGGLARGPGAAIEAEMGLRLPRWSARQTRSPPSWADASSPAATRAKSIRWTPPRAASTGCSKPTAGAQRHQHRAVGAKWVAYFGDQHAQAYAVDAATGALLWKVRVEEHPAAMITGAPALYEGRLYVPDLLSMRR